MKSLFKAELRLSEKDSLSPWANFEYYIVAQDAASALKKAYDAAEKETKGYPKGSKLLLMTLHRVSDEVTL